MPKFFCENNRCSEHGFCDLWNECPLFVGSTIDEERAYKQKQASEKKKAQPPIRPTEDDEQKVVIDYCELKRLRCVHIANEGLRSKAYGARLQRLGMRKGFPDLFLPYARQGFHGLFIEMKRDSKAKATAEQKEWIDFLNRQGYKAVICYGADMAIGEIGSYFSEAK